MALNQDLTAFVKDALQRGVARGEIEAVLLRTGWPHDQVRRAMAGFADVEFAIPVPRPIPTVSAREAFMYVLMFATLFISAYSLGDLVFDLINRAFPDPASPGFERSTLQSIRWSLSCLIVAFPIFVWVAWLIAGLVRRDPTKRASKIRSRLTYVTLFLAACVLIGDVISVVYSFLGGELTARFVLKVLTVALIAGAVFGYYLADLRTIEEKEPET
jgi:Domain of unknown function (DUF5671)